MIVNGHLTAFAEEGEPIKIREIEIPTGSLDDKRRLLEQAFHYGQNEFSYAEGCYSISVGDVIEIQPGELWMVLPVGFGRLEGLTVADLPRGAVARQYAYDFPAKELK